MARDKLKGSGKRGAMASRVNVTLWNVVQRNICIILPLFVMLIVTLFKTTGPVWDDSVLVLPYNGEVNARELRFIQASLSSTGHHFSCAKPPCSKQRNSTVVVTEKSKEEKSNEEMSKEEKSQEEKMKKENSQIVPIANETAVQERQTNRKSLIKEICAKYKSIARLANRGWAMKLNTKDKYLLCPIPKSGWSSWKRLWFYTSGIIDDFATDVGIKSDKLAGVVDIRGSSLSTAWKNKRYNFAFAFFRNPWERLMSAYINKAVDYNYSRILHTPCKWESMKPFKEDLTFTQFLTCIAGGSNDMHWVPQSKLCNVCSITFDFIGHLETVEEDAAAVIENIGLRNVTYPHSFASKKHDTLKVMESQYKNVPDDILKKLLNIFKYDFELHGYDKHPPGRPDIE